MFSRPALSIGLTAGTDVPAIPLTAQPGPACGAIARYDMPAGTVTDHAMGEMYDGGAAYKLQHEPYLRFGPSQLSTKGASRTNNFSLDGRLGKPVAPTAPHKERGYTGAIPQRPESRLSIRRGRDELAHSPGTWMQAPGLPVVLSANQCDAAPKNRGSRTGTGVLPRTEGG